MKNIDTHYEADTKEQLEESLLLANRQMDRCIELGYCYVRIVISDHWASEGVWVEARQASFTEPLPDCDFCYRLYHNPLNKKEQHS